MKEDFDKLIETVVNDPAALTDPLMEDIAKKYGVCKKTTYTRLRTMYGKTLREVLRDKLTPSKEELSSLILNSTHVEEVWASLKRGKDFYKGLFDQYYGVSTYTKARLEILKTASVVPYVVTREDNRSIVYSQLLGDGTYDKRRHALRIVHGIKQAEYLKAKVAMLCKAFPKLSCEVKVRQHNQGHMYADWYSRHLGNIDIPEKEDYPTLVPKLTPLGWLLWFLDDGCLGQDLMICTLNKDLQKVAVKELASYGILAREGHQAVHMKGQENTVRFYKNFIEPLLHLVPKCMQYKVKI